MLNVFGAYTSNKKAKEMHKSSTKNAKCKAKNTKKEYVLEKINES
jgi:hypothetical protein